VLTRGCSSGGRQRRWAESMAARRQRTMSWDSGAIGEHVDPLLFPVSWRSRRGESSGGGSGGQIQATAVLRTPAVAGSRHRLHSSWARVRGGGAERYSRGRPKEEERAACGPHRCGKKWRAMRAARVEPTHLWFCWQNDESRTTRCRRCP
jgi:hypothetical protein